VACAHLEQLLPTMLVSAEGVGPLLVLKTTTGAAQALGLALDGAGWSEIIGTIAVTMPSRHHSQRAKPPRGTGAAARARRTPA